MRMTAKLLVVVMCAMAFAGTSLADMEPYTVKLEGSAGIYEGPGADYALARSVGEDGVYTIVEEAMDAEGCLWGRLKSGAGWVLLDSGRQIFIHETPYTTVLSATDAICAGPGYDFEYVQDVGKDGIYTIVEETVGEDGFLWGRLKSGAGWVRLSDAALEAPMWPEDSSYTMPLGDWVPVYSAPDQENTVCVGIVGEDGVYTIVNETLDELGNLWGELKSGAGWVNLSYVRMAGQPLLTAYEAEALEMIDAERCDCIVDDSEYMMRIAFRANGELRNLKFTALRYDTDTYVVQQEYYWTPEMEEDTYFVAGVVFYGVMTTYGISFEDAEGETHYYAASLSGLDGSVVLNEYIP